MSITSHFATKIYTGQLPTARAAPLNSDLAATAYALSTEDKAGQRWCKDHAYPGYTSYGSLNDLPWRASVFADLQKWLDAQVARFAKQLAFDLRGDKLVCDSLWVNILAPGGHHSGHIHPRSVVSGTYYIDVPRHAAALRFEDPRLALMMAAPLRRADAAADLQTFVSHAPKPGQVLLWESWLRHDVPRNLAKTDRLSVSFNYALEPA
jgi:uncharacterized protein (TIGR02466 family)